MVLYDTCLLMSLTRFGIDIPVRDERSTHTMQALNVTLGDESSWRLPFHPPTIAREDLLRVHTEDFVNRLYGSGLEAELLQSYELYREGKPWRYRPTDAELPLSKLFDIILRHVGGTLQTAEWALKHGFCFFLGGGLHHAMPGYGSGFCLVNDIVIALRRLRADGTARRFWIIDTDAHKGDGTAVLCAHDDNCATLSIHMAHSWPLDEAPHDADGRLKPSFVPSTVDIPIAEGEEPVYLMRLASGLHELAERFPDPDLVFVVAGADPWEHDELASTKALRLNLSQMFERDRLVMEFIEKHTLPSAWLMAGGYGQRSWEVYSQFLTWRHQR